MPETVMDLEFLAHLPAQRDLLKRVLARYAPDERVLGLMLYGSLAQGQGDEFSDIDLNILANPAHHSELIAEAPATAAGFGRPLYTFRDRDDPAQFYAYYDCHVKLDLDFMLPGRIGVYVERRNHRVFKDVTGELAQAVERAALLPERFVPDFADLAALDAMFWIRCTDIATKTVRGEFWHACHAVERLRGETLPSLASYLDGLRPIGYRRIEKRVSSDWLTGWEATIARPERDSVLAALAALIACYTRLRDTLAEQTDLSFGLASEDLLRRRLLELGVPLALPA